MMKVLQIIILLLLPFSLSFCQERKTTVTFESEDGITITADKYLVNEEYPYIVLLHQAGSSRGEYNEIATRLLKFRYNCLAVDLRSGETANYVRNETARATGGSSYKYIDAAPDIRAAINYAWSQNPKPIILFGSSYSASLAMLEGEKNPNVKAVIAFSPGEYFGTDLRMEESIQELTKPLFIASTQQEESYTREMMKNVPGDGYTLFVPEKAGVHGAKALWQDNPSKDEYWLAILLFIHNLNQ